MPEVRVSRIEHQRRRLEVQIDAVKSVLRYDLRHRVHEVGNARCLRQREILPAAAQRDQHLFPLAL